MALADAPCSSTTVPRLGAPSPGTWIITLVVEARYPPAGRRVAVEGGHLAVIEAGPGEGAGVGGRPVQQHHRAAARRPLARAGLDDREVPALDRGTVVLLHGASANAMDPMLAIGRRLAGDGFRVLSFRPR
jgi:pimeloyl-ACP methyl ester carboxylesterase